MSHSVMRLLNAPGEYAHLDPVPSLFFLVCSYVRIPMFVISTIWERLI